MKSSRTWIVWLSLAVCAVTVIFAMTWLTRNVLAANREQAAAEQKREAAEARADLEERTRLALWRLDALGAATVLRENQHATSHYETLTNSPFLTASEPDVLLHFQIQQAGGLTSPELDEHNARESGVSEKVITERKSRMKRLRELLAANPLPGDEWAQLNCAAEVGQTSWNAVPLDAVPEQASNKILRLNNDGGKNRLNATYQANSNVSERVQRAKAVAKNYANQQIELQAPADQRQASAARQEAPNESDARDAAGQPAFFANRVAALGEIEKVTQMRGVWLAGELFLLRQLTRSSPKLWSHGEDDLYNKYRSVQGVWMNAAALRSLLLNEITDLLPRATLSPADGKDAAKNPMAMVSLPFLLVRNEVIAVNTSLPKALIGTPLVVGWAAVLLAILATSLLVRGIMRLSERRASFVSAVTHELRTPLTTFRLYSDMLESGAVKPEKRGHYLSVLTREADRLSHLVENVLAFSRIERGNARSNIRETFVGELLERSRERFEARLATAELSLDMGSTDPTRVRADTAAVEHILFNLIDNAAKYAAHSDPPVVEIRSHPIGKYVAITVRDHGPGIPPAERSRIFRAFHKSAREAAESQPGVGLGLALSRRLAKAQGGELRYDGTAFELRLPAA